MSKAIGKFHNLAVSYITSLPVSDKSRRNYLSDVNHFISWIEVNADKYYAKADSVSGILDRLELKGFAEYLRFLRDSKLSKVTVRRRMTTIGHIRRGFEMDGYGEGRTRGQREGILSVDYYKYAVLGLLGVAIVAGFGKTDVSKMRGEIDRIELREGSLLRDSEVAGSSGIILAEGSIDALQFERVGDGVLVAGADKSIVRTEAAHGTSLILVSPTSSTKGENLFVMDKGEGYFIVSVDKAIDEDISFNWLAK